MNDCRSERPLVDLDGDVNTARDTRWAPPSHKAWKDLQQELFNDQTGDYFALYLLNKCSDIYSCHFPSLSQYKLYARKHTDIKQNTLMHSHAIIISKYITYIKSLNDTRDRKCSNSFKDIRLINVSFRHLFFFKLLPSWHRHGQRKERREQKREERMRKREDKGEDKCQESRKL